ncbi:MAG TPA: 16S rRNA (adenine(1518)-N(6)/adenine(1519)-N(6))-dimethyltransferase RsmA [Candidatus Omnitrophota bacterium]|nr:16S rRNA (adenine(1518)-N(6)/adenine(1519)-N(6))-dimethyltransferase RsmA [Candidatus Omnitrophota bacterium]
MLTQIELLKKYNLKIRGHLGQHLLLDPNIIRKIVDALDLEPGASVFEIGPGLGAVTHEILKRGFPVLAIEKDPKFVEVLNQELVPDYGGRFKLIHEDILKSDLAQLVSNHAGKKVKVKVIGNLPYYISTPILFHLIEHAAVFSKAVLMLQKEVALRLSAKAGDEDYSRLSVTGRLYGETKFLFDVSPSCFLPHPQVMSRVISFEFRPFPAKICVPKDELLLDVIRVAFSQRRKTLLSLLVHHFQFRIHRRDLELIFSRLGWALQVRGEELSLEQFFALAKEVGSFIDR